MSDKTLSRDNRKPTGVNAIDGGNEQGADAAFAYKEPAARWNSLFPKDYYSDNQAFDYAAGEYPIVSNNTIAAMQSGNPSYYNRVLQNTSEGESGTVTPRDYANYVQDQYNNARNQANLMNTASNNQGVKQAISNILANYPRYMGTVSGSGTGLGRNYPTNA